MMVLRSQHQRVGIINPSYQEFALPDQRRRIAGGYGAANQTNDRVIGIFHIQNHWVAYLVNRKINSTTNKATCFMFDPMQSEWNYAIIEKSVRGVIEELLELKDAVVYSKVKWCRQQDGSSCGVWCIAVLEMMLNNEPWDDCIYRLQPYLRMRFLQKAITFVEKEAAIMQLPATNVG
ncbi:12-oxophytodienoate reductase 3 [Phytophthora nicotianae]|uniref:12-oxophytodienoate reductase 3 n=1 Tax=Phytophthora nicotianae TaxID=4792 RepID=A0A0W8C0N5_PHYNI|nr:12-oxophytodienoate reductase 3 [Phytophthora nicotianae]